MFLHKAPHLKIDFGLSCGHTQAERWCINSTVTLSKDEKLILGEVWELCEEALQGFVIIISNLKQRDGCSFYFVCPQTILHNVHCFIKLTWLSSIV